ncbi:hypothetical protein B0F90DRAFT_1936153 [Multifurca ochricompacta]|uniref:Peptide hydrolase n=1 Tax=Multifurca ochricompacta TaxID=376703 RepID=A0AAD4QNX2_9AGAM|nr:hypothetical protein B0F90DRAFT_1936153 [Multifurca ochricompacta]
MTTTLSSILQSLFSFRTGSTTVFAVLFYFAVFLSLYLTQYGPQVPSLERQHAFGLSVESAYRDLHRIAERPHPYNSRQNDVVHDFLLSRLRGIAKGHNFVHVDDDTRTNATFLDGPKAVYFEGKNILVKVDGTDDAAEGHGVLFSAHFDSVSTAPGATDDGMSVAALVQMIDFLSKNRPRRTAVFNLNNGEEDGLNGAHAFLRHPWSNLTSRFLNIEGAGSGGYVSYPQPTHIDLPNLFFPSPSRPFVFRTTSYDVLNAFRSAPHIHADVLSQDAWDRGVIRSDTDYSVYSAPHAQRVSRSAGNKKMANATTIVHGYRGAGGGMQGADVAFYHARSRYHTMDDSIRGMGDGGAQRSLWSLLELLRNVGDSILNSKPNDEATTDETERAVYFELFGVYLVAFRSHTFLLAEIILLAIGPIVLAGLGYLLLQQTIASPTLPSRVQWGSGFRGYGRFWLAIVLGAGAQVGLVYGFLKLNHNTAHAHPVATSLSALTLAYLFLAIPLQVAQRVRPIPPSKQRSIILIELYALTWVLLVGATALLERLDVAGLYWVALWNASLLVAGVLSAFEGLWGTGKAGRVILPREEDDEDEGGNEQEDLPYRTSRQRERQEEEEASETAPLLGQRRQQRKGRKRTQDKAYFWWIFQFLFSATAPVVNLASIFAIWIGAMPQTIPDGGWVGIVYAPISLLSFLMLLPLAPFIHKVHRLLTLVILLVFIASTAYAWLATPFTPDARLKVFFAHEVQLTNLSRAVTITEGTRPPSPPRLQPLTLPSSWHDWRNGDDDDIRVDVGVHCEEGMRGLTKCAWNVPSAFYPWIPTGSSDGGRGDSWIVANVTRLGPLSLRIEIEGFETRACRIFVDSHGIRRYRRKMGWSGEFEIPEEGEERMDVHVLSLWARDWNSNKFEVELDVDDDDNDGDDEVSPPSPPPRTRIMGRVSCLWNDGPPGGARIPALEEARAFLPEWVAVTKASDGLLEAVSGFVV